MAISKQSFKRQLRLSGNTESTLHLFPHNTSRDNQVIFAQLRSNFSDLKGHLFSKGCASESACHCGHLCEDTEHYLLYCNTFAQQRQELFQKISGIEGVPAPTAALLLFGHPELHDAANIAIFQYTCEFIKHSGRFKL